MQLRSWVHRRVYHIVTLLATVGCSSGEYIFQVADSAAPLDYDAPPLANAGEDREVLRGYPTCLNAAGSYHPLGRSFGARWTRTSGEAVFLSNATSLTPCFVAPLAEQSLTFRLTLDDGDYETSDEVTLWVRGYPEAVAPHALAGPDGIQQPGDSFEPTAADVALSNVDPGSVTWEAVPVRHHRAGLSQGADGTSMQATLPSVYRLTATREGLGSAPDYFLLWPTAGRDQLRRAPSIRVEGPTSAEPGSTILLRGFEAADAESTKGSADGTDGYGGDNSAEGSENTTGEAWRWRWQQVSGDPVEFIGTADAGASVSLKLPRRPQRLRFRAEAADDFLMSSPAEFTVQVAIPNNTPSPWVAPLAELETHPGNTVWIDGLGGRRQSSEADVSFVWEQTHGPTLPVTSQGNGRFAYVQAPLDEGGDFAFAVHAERFEIRSDPAVIQLRVRTPQEENTEPQLFLCAAAWAGDTGSFATLRITASARDPENDTIAQLKLQPLEPEPEASVLRTYDSLDPDGSGEDGEPALAPCAEAGPAPLAPPEGIALPLRSLAVDIAVRGAALDSPLRIRGKACDAHGACSSEKIEIVTRALLDADDSLISP